MPDNLINYEKQSVVTSYRDKRSLSPPEQAILSLVSRGSTESMLDIGVGAGRTTRAFARVFRQYTGIDYSASMIEAARQKYIAHPQYNFVYCDARNMSVFSDSSFDFVLFSFNGIDCVPYSDRQIILSEVKRIGKGGAYFAFSTHNLYSAPVLYSFRFPKNPFGYIKEFRRFRKVRRLNPPLQEILDKDFVALVDGDIDFEAEYLYYKPEKQIRELTEHGFADIEVFSLKTGKKIDAATPWKRISDPWLYFLCRNSK